MSIKFRPGSEDDFPFYQQVLCWAAYWRERDDLGLEKLILEAVSANIAQLSLSVERDNPALQLYKSVDFKKTDVVGNAVTMLI